ncbi:MAG TPA: PqqD family peptide modification chaperone, partial [Gemmatimonadaceae bacterium]|nr:PqqD family peptide modification chaperone [Gemmatimonadaceae bacterium]
LIDFKLEFGRTADGAVLLHTGQEIYFGLNEVGAAIWELLPPVSSSLDEICEKLAERYPDAPRDELRNDVETLLADLLREGLVTLVAAPEPRGESAT